MISRTLREIRADYAAGRTPDDVVDEVLARVAATSELHAWISVVDGERLRAQADELGPWTVDAGSLWGVPFAVKDNIDVLGLPTTAACPAFTYEPDAHAVSVARLVAAGALPVGKTNLDQFATGLSGTRSPHGIVRSTLDAGLIGGGSSSGSAVAVAAGIVPFALGTDTAGSGRVPAACQGIVGMKPSVGLVPTRGVVPACASLDCVSVFAATADDAWTVVDAMAGFDPDDPFSRHVAAREPPSRPLRIGVPADAEAIGAPKVFTDRAERLAGGLGASLVPVDLAAHLEAGALLYQGAWLAERYEAVGGFLAEHPDEVEATVAAVVDGGRTIRGAQVFADLHRRDCLARATEQTWGLCDVLLLPTVARVPTVDELLAEPIVANARLGRFTTFVNVLRMAAVAFPAGDDAEGRPFGVSFVGAEGTDRWLCGLATGAAAALR